MKLLLLLSLLIVSDFTFCQTRLNGNTLTLTDGRTIQTGSYMKISRPSKGSHFAYIFNELSLRASSEDDLPSGVGASISGKEVNVKRFIVRRGLKAEKYYVVTSGAFINSAIDIEQALKSGEVLLPQKRPSASSNDITLHADSNNSSLQNGNQTTGTGALNSNSAKNRLMKKPWEQQIPSAVGMKSIAGSPDSAKRQDSIHASDRFSKEFKRSDSINNNQFKKTQVSKDSMLTSTGHSSPLPVENSTQAQGAATSLNPPVANGAIPVLGAGSGVGANAGVGTNAASGTNAAAGVVAGFGSGSGSGGSITSVTGTSTVTSPVSGVTTNHEISSMMTVPAPDAVKAPSIDAVKTSIPANSAGTPGYDKYTKLKQLKELLDSGVLSKQEFEAEKKKILTVN